MISTSLYFSDGLNELPKPLNYIHEIFISSVITPKEIALMSSAGNSFGNPLPWVTVLAKQCPDCFQFHLYLHIFQWKLSCHKNQFCGSTFLIFLLCSDYGTPSSFLCAAILSMSDSDGTLLPVTQDMKALPEPK